MVTGKAVATSLGNARIRPVHLSKSISEGKSISTGLQTQHNLVHSDASQVILPVVLVTTAAAKTCSAHKHKCTECSETKVGMSVEGFLSLLSLHSLHCLHSQPPLSLMQQARCLQA